MVHHNDVNMSEGDDLMNLGPFIKNYVFNAHPLNNLSLIAKLDHGSHGDDDGDKDVVVRRMSPKCNGGSNVDAAGAVCKAIHNNGGTGQSLPYKKRNWENVYSGWSPPKFKPKYMTEKQTKIKNWLTVNFQYCPRHKNAKVSSRVVLAKAVKEFGPLTQKALGYLMYQAFPGVERMKDTRKGHIFKGILEKSQSKSKRSSSRGDLDRSRSPPSRPTSHDHDKHFYHHVVMETAEDDENEAPPGTETESADDDGGRHATTGGYELVEVKVEPHEEYQDERMNGYNSPHGMDLRTTKSAELKQEVDYVINGERHYDSEPPLSPVSDNGDLVSAPLMVANYPLLRQSLRGKVGFIHPDDLSDGVPTASFYPIDRTVLGNGSTVFHPQPAFFKLPPTLPEAHEQLAYLLRYIQSREEKFADVEKQFSNLAGEFQKMAAVLREFHVDQVEFFKKVGYAHVPSCDGNNN